MNATMATRRYGWFSHRGMGTAEDVTRCVAEVVRPGGHAPEIKQCGCKRGHGPGGEYCARHATLVAAGQRVNVPQARDAD